MIDEGAPLLQRYQQRLEETRSQRTHDYHSSNSSTHQQDEARYYDQFRYFLKRDIEIMHNAGLTRRERSFVLDLYNTLITLCERVHNMRLFLEPTKAAEFYSIPLFRQTLEENCAIAKGVTIDDKRDNHENPSYMIAINLFREYPKRLHEILEQGYNAQLPLCKELYKAVYTKNPQLALDFISTLPAVIAFPPKDTLETFLSQYIGTGMSICVEDSEKAARIYFNEARHSLNCLKQHRRFDLTDFFLEHYIFISKKGTHPPDRVIQFVLTHATPDEVDILLEDLVTNKIPLKVIEELALSDICSYNTYTCSQNEIEELELPQSYEEGFKAFVGPYPIMQLHKHADILRIIIKKTDESKHKPDWKKTLSRDEANSPDFSRKLWKYASNISKEQSTLPKGSHSS